MEVETVSTTPPILSPAPALSEITESPALTKNESSNSTSSSKAKTAKKFIYFTMYILIYAFHGCLLSMPGAIYLELQQQLNTSSQTISWIYSSMAISSACSAILSGIIIQKFKSTHKYLAVMVLLEVIALCVIPFNQHVYIAFILFIAVGAGYSAVDICASVFIFRAFPIDGQHKFFLTQTVLSICSTSMPLIIELSLNKTNEYYIPLIIVAFIGFIFVFMAVLIPTPRHDELRTIKRQVSIKYASVSNLSDAEVDQYDTDTITQHAANASFILESDTTYTKLKYFMISMLVFLMFLFGTLLFGMNSFITTYCIEYLNIDAKYGRYLISSYWASNVFYRLFNVTFHKLVSCTISPVGAVVVAFIVQCIIIGVAWIPFADVDSNIILMFAVFILSGFFTSPIFPGVAQWCELLTPMNGYISCFLMIGYQSGIAIISPILGISMAELGAYVLPIILLIPSIIASILSFANILLHHKCYKQKENTAIDSTRDINAQ
eukprot:357400_1